MHCHSSGLQTPVITLIQLQASPLSTHGHVRATTASTTATRAHLTHTSRLLSGSSLNHQHQNPSPNHIHIHICCPPTHLLPLPKSVSNSVDTPHCSLALISHLVRGKSIPNAHPLHPHTHTDQKTCSVVYYLHQDLFIYDRFFSLSLSLSYPR